MNDQHAQVYPYAVGALPPDEAQKFTAHLASCADCSAELAHLREVTAELSHSVATDPPPALRSTVLAVIERTPQQPGNAYVATDSNTAPDSAASRENSTVERSVGNVVPLRRVQPSRLPALLAAAVALAALALGGWALQSRQAANETADQATAQARQISQLLSAEDVQVVRGRGVTTHSAGAVVMSPSRKQAMFVAADLPNLPEGKVYEAWTIDQEPAPAGTFSAEEAKTMVPLPGTAFEAQSVAITVEPAGGSPEPTSDAIFTVSMPQ
jgi:anti-sigma-K factor RskA